MGQAKSIKVHSTVSVINPILPLWKTLRRRILEKDLRKGNINLFGTIYTGRLVYR